MEYCDNEGCTGHLGKFSSCLDEALYEDSMDGTGQITGNDDFEGTFVLEDYETDATLYLDEYRKNPVFVPKGAYIVHTASSGIVTVNRYDSLEEAQIVFNAAEQAFAAYENETYPSDESDESDEMDKLNNLGESFNALNLGKSVETDN